MVYKTNKTSRKGRVPLHMIAVSGGIGDYPPKMLRAYKVSNTTSAAAELQKQFG